ncbi:g8059 [Coccomyxa viridis]|uniref:G8059 protein n=1 Tax=Coccomyxa viridis TaxID=1274662 RepID=A0ABP1FZG4_9CHLO
MADYTKNLTEQAPPAYGNVQYTFDAIGDTQGQENFVAQTYDFVVTDMALTQAQLKQANRAVVQIPWAVNALGAAHNVPGIASGVMRLDAYALAGIMQCIIMQWNDPYLVSLNPNITLPNVTIKAVARIDKATGNYMLSSFLNATTPAWKPGVAKTFAWPSCVHRVKGAPDLLAYLNNTPYAAGVIQHVLLEDQNIPYARVQNRAGNFVLPGQANFSTLGPEFTLPQSVTSPDWANVVIGNSMSPDTYPLAGLDFFIINQNSRYMGYPESKLLRDMAFGLLQPAVQAALPRYRFAPTPKTLLSLANQAYLVAVNANDNDTDPTPGVTAQGVASSAGVASAGAPRMTWWGGLIIGVVVLLVLLAAVLAAFLLRRRWRRQRQVDENKGMMEMNGNGHHTPLKPGSNGSGGGYSRGGSDNKGSDGRTSGSREQMQALAMISGHGQPLTTNGVSCTRGSLRSNSDSYPSFGPSALSGPSRPGSQGTGPSGPGGTPGTRGSGRESSLMSMRDLLRARSEAPLEALELGPIIGRGSFGRVYRGRWRAGSVAVKIINHDRNVGNNFDAMRESVLCSNINHPNVVMTYKVHTIMQSQTESLHASMGLVREASQCMSPPAVLVTDSSGERDLSDQLLETWMLLEYCDQGNLESAAREARFQRDYATIYLCLMDIASGMDYLHSLGVLHGDVKGANVLLKTTAPTSYDRRGFVCKMADFGLSRVLEANATHVSTFTYGTAAYMAPELLQKGKMTRAADVYSFAMIMVELFTCKRLFEGLAQQQIMYQVFSGQKPPLDRTGMPEAYGQLIDDCWQDDPEQRPTFAVILQRLRGMYKDERQRLHDLQLQAGEPITPVSQPSPRPQHSLGTSEGAQQLVLQQLQQQHRQQQQQQLQQINSGQVLQA